MKNGWQRPGATGALPDSDEEDDLDMTPDILRRRRLRARAAARAREDAFGTSTPESDFMKFWDVLEAIKQTTSKFAAG